MYKVSLLVLGLLLSSSCAPLQKPTTPEVGVNAKLKEHTREFKKEVVRVHEKIHVAVGYGLANSIMVEAPEGLIIIDTMETREEAQVVLDEFRKISTKPIKAIIYTHNHTDHIFGAEVFTEGNDVPVFAHETTRSLIERLVNVVKDSITARSLRMFGVYLDPAGLENAGIGPHLGITPKSTLGAILPTHVFKDELKVTVAGLDIELYHAPGETSDQLFVHIPAFSAIFPGDNFYRAFPNLYTIRGTPYRDVMQWVSSLDHIIGFEPEFLVPSHTRPLQGKATIESALTDYRDAIQFVHDQTIRGVNLGLTPDQIVAQVTLPKKLASSPYLAEHYGKVEWSVRAIFSGYLGWFNGVSRSLHPVGFDSRAEEVLALIGSEEKAITYLRAQIKAGKTTWALEVADYILSVHPTNQQASELKIEVLSQLGEAEENANARHYYLTQARETRLGTVDYFQPTPSRGMLEQFKLETILASLSVHLSASKARDQEKKVVLEFQDAGEVFSIHVRNQVAVITPRDIFEDPDIRVVADSLLFKEMLAQLRSPALTLPRFEYKEGSLIDFAKFLLLFEPGRYQN